MKKICIVTVYKSLNSGSFWQAKALGIAIERLGYNVVYYKMPYPWMKQVEKYINIGKLLIKQGWTGMVNYIVGLRDFADNQKRFPVINSNDADIGCYVLGSDTIWNLESSSLSSNRSIYWGGKFKGNHIITYAGSVANSPIGMFLNYPELSKMASLWEHVSVRDQYTYDVIKSMTNKKIYKVCDPTLLLTKIDYSKLIKPNEGKKKFLFLYLFKSPTDNQMEEINSFAKSHNLILIQGTGIRKMKFVDKVIPNSPSFFLQYFYNAEYVITDTFHGVMFSINFEKNFLVLQRNKNKVNDLLVFFDLNNRIVDFETDIVNRLNLPIDYHNLKEKIGAMRDASWEYLKESLDVFSAGA